MTFPFGRTVRSASGAFSAWFDAMLRPTLAAQTNTISRYVKTPADFADSMRRIHKIGYTAVQLDTNHVPVGPAFPPADIKRIVDDAGLRICNAHILWENIIADIDTALGYLQVWNCQHLAIPVPPRGLRKQEAADYRAFAQEATQVGQRLAEADVTFSYHNHSSELMRLGSRTGLDIIFAESDPRYVLAEIDTYWIQHGGGDPADWIRRMKNRMPVVHFKDMVILEDGSQTFAEVGEGNLNWPAILAASQDAGVSWYVVEQDTCRGDPFESLRISYQNLTKMGLT